MSRFQPVAIFVSKATFSTINSEEPRRVMCYAIVIEKAPSNYSAYVPDLPGCVATGATIEEIERQIKEAIAFHLDGLREEGLPIHEPTTLYSESS